MFKYGMWMGELFKKHGEFVRWYAILPSVAILFSVFSLIISPVYTTPIIVLLLMGILYLILVFIASIQVIFKMKSKYGLYALVVIPVQHITYGMGFLYSFANSLCKSKGVSSSIVQN
jgi:uncharacterized membrane protein